MARIRTTLRAESSVPHERAAAKREHKLTLWAGLRGRGGDLWRCGFVFTWDFPMISAKPTSTVQALPWLTYP